MIMTSTLTKEDIRSLFQEMFDEQRQHILTIISNNTKIYTNELQKQISRLKESIDNDLELVNEKIVILRKECDDLKLSVETIDEVHNNNINTAKGDFKELKKENNSMKKKLRELEDRSRRNNLRIDGLSEHLNETWEDTEKKVLRVFREKLHIQSQLHIERAHRVGTLKDDRPRTIVLKMLEFKQKELILRNASKLKGTGIYINEDFCQETMEIRRKLKGEMLQKRKEKKYCIISYDRLIVKPLRLRNADVGC